MLIFLAVNFIQNIPNSEERVCIPFPMLLPKPCLEGCLLWCHQFQHKGVQSLAIGSDPLCSHEGCFIHRLSQETLKILLVSCFLAVLPSFFFQHGTEGMESAIMTLSLLNWKGAGIQVLHFLSECFTCGVMELHPDSVPSKKGQTLYQHSRENERNGENENRRKWYVVHPAHIQALICGYSSVLIS